MQLDLLKFRVYDHNIRYDNRKPTRHERLWEERKVPSIASMKFSAQQPNTVICLQEVLHNQLLDIQKELGDEWTYYGIGRDDGKTKGEFAPIFYKKSEWESVKNETYWLSETPDVPSRGWDAALKRIVGYVRLKNKGTGREIGVFNTHYDHQGVEARKESSKLIISKMESEMKEVPVVLTGDFNSTREDIAYKTLSGSLDDSGEILPENYRYGHTLTFSGFNSDEAPKYIDFIWLPRNRGVSLESFGILHSEFHQFKFSDHRPVCVDLKV